MARTVFRDVTLCWERASPSGVWKESSGASAKALKQEYIYICLAGWRDKEEADVMGVE